MRNLGHHIPMNFTTCKGLLVHLVGRHEYPDRELKWGKCGMHIELCRRNCLENVNPKDVELDGRRTLK